MPNNRTASLSGNIDQLAAVGMTRRWRKSRLCRPGGKHLPIQSATASHLSCSLGAARQSAVLNRLRRALAQEVSENVPTWRRVLAFINPYSWAFTRGEDTLIFNYFGLTMSQELPADSKTDSHADDSASQPADDQNLQQAISVLQTLASQSKSRYSAEMM